MSFVGGALKLKGGAAPKPGQKKRKQKKAQAETQALLEQGTTAGSEADGSLQTASGSKPPPAPADRRTAAERRADEHRKKREGERVAKAASKSHRERIAEMNEKLANLTEHHDLFRISYTA
ncbi:hypothetical protein H632_c2812p0 [Helicosporidium sp. ATCC 50920]|nr:hypothetical protein H632_c2812p0 [Helicosporidium sp. ATCC 50920]|eukprot:KDD72852.1 hypothetical protein H632_c2812p0 [Helicosporidium sp. ATCC 50920]